MKIPEGVTNIFFDAWGTLLHDPSKSIPQICKKLEVSLRDRPTKDAFEEAVHIDGDTAAQIDHFLHLLKKQATRELRVELSTLLRNSSENAQWFPDVMDALPTLAQTHQLGIISNSSRQAATRIRSLIQHDMPETVTDHNLFFSCDLGLRKPDPAIFRQVAKDLDAKPANCLFIGDNPNDDYFPALEAEWRATFLARKTKHREEAMKRGIPYIVSIGDLPARPSLRADKRTDSL